MGTVVIYIVGIVEILVAVYIAYQGWKIINQKRATGAESGFSAGIGLLMGIFLWIVAGAFIASGGLLIVTHSFFSQIFIVVLVVLSLLYVVSVKLKSAK